MAVTAQELIDRARQRGEYQNDPLFHDQSELLPWCRESYKELWDIIIQAYGEDYVVIGSLQNALFGTPLKVDALDPPFYKLWAISWLKNDLVIPLLRWEQQYSVQSSAAGEWQVGGDIYYQLVGPQID